MAQPVNTVLASSACILHFSLACVRVDGRILSEAASVSQRLTRACLHPVMPSRLQCGRHESRQRCRRSGLEASSRSKTLLSGRGCSKGTGNHVRAGRSPPPDPDQPAVKSFDDYDTWPATAPPPRRLLVGSLTALGIALGGNLGGITSALLGAPLRASVCQRDTRSNRTLHKAGHTC